MLKKEILVLIVSFLLVSIMSFSSVLQEPIIKEHLWLKKNNWLQREEKLAPKKLKPVSCVYYQAWADKLQQKKYQLQEDEIKIPNWKVTKLPTNLHQITDLSKKKRIFFSLVLVGAYHANRRLLTKRSKLKQLKQNLAHLNETQKKWLKNKFHKYEVKGKNWGQRIKELKRKLNIVPLSLILAQAACESGWGTSRFAQQANNIFGEWTFSTQEAGIVPKERPPGADYKIETFSTVQASINSYLLTLNSHPAYKKFRFLRYRCRQRNKLLTGLKLLPGLINYSEQGRLYLNKIKAIIKDNNLTDYDKLLRRSKEE